MKLLRMIFFWGRGGGGGGEGGGGGGKWGAAFWVEGGRGGKLGAEPKMNGRCTQVHPQIHLCRSTYGVFNIVLGIVHSSFGQEYFCIQKIAFTTMAKLCCN